MRKLSIVVAVIVMLGVLPAVASEPECTVVEILHIDGRPKAGEVYWAGGPHYSVNGSFVWFDFGLVASSGESDTVSVDVSDEAVVSATGCPDGSITLDRADGPVVDGPSEDPQPEPEPVTVVPVCEVYAATLERYCSLPNRILVVS